MYLNSPEHSNAIVQGPNSKAFKFKKSLCEECNSCLTQPYDLAWQALSKWLKYSIAVNDLQAIANVSDCFEKKHQIRRIRQCHLYFVKWFGCQLVEANCNFDRAGFAKALENGVAYQDLYLKIGKSMWNTGGAGQSDLNARFESERLVHATQVYDAGDGLAVFIIYSRANTSKINAMDGAWHPKFGPSLKFLEENLL